MNSAQKKVKPELRNQLLHQSCPYNWVMLLQSSSSPQDPHPGKVYGIVHILLALNIHIVAASGDQLTKADTVGWKTSPGVQPPAGDFIQRSMLGFPLLHGLSAKLHISLYLCLPRSRIRISYSLTSLQGTMHNRPQCPVTTADSAAGCNKNHIVDESPKIRCTFSLTQSHSYPRGLSLGNK